MDERSNTQVFWAWILALACVAFELRFGQARRLPENLVVGDALYYHELANLIAEGRGFINPYNWLGQHREVPSAFHPPLYSLVLAGGSVLGGTSVLGHELVACVVGAAACIVIGLLGRELGGPRVGIIAAAIAAVFPQRWLVDGILYSEGLAAGLTALVLLLVYRLRRRPSFVNAAVLGAALGAAALTRFETLLLAVLVVAPIVLGLRGLSWRRRWALISMVGAVTVAVLAPWLIRNARTFERPVLGSNNGEAVIFFANCHSTYYTAERLGSWDTTCGRERGTFVIRCDWVDTVDRTACGDEARRSASLRDRGWQYLWEHRGRFVTVVAPARVARVWGMYRPFDDAVASIGVLNRYRDLTNLGVWCFWAVLLGSSFGVVVLRRRGAVPVWPLLMPALVVTIVAVYAYGTMRFRAVVEPSLFVLAALAIEVPLRRLIRSKQG